MALLRHVRQRLHRAMNQPIACEAEPPQFARCTAPDAPEDTEPPPAAGIIRTMQRVRERFDRLVDDAHARGEMPDLLQAYHGAWRELSCEQPPDASHARLLEELKREGSRMHPHTGLLRDLLCESLCIFGATDDPAWVKPVRDLYDRMLLRSAPADRMSLYQTMQQRVLGRRASVNVLLPFLFSESEPDIVCPAAIDLAMAGSYRGDDPLVWPRELVAFMADNSLANRGAVFGALVVLGDERVHRLLHEVKWRLSLAELRVAARCTNGQPTVATVDFWLTWLEELASQDLSDTASFWECANALWRLPPSSHDGHFLDARRNYGYLHQGAGVLPVVVLARRPVHQVGQSIAPRLHALMYEDSWGDCIERLMQAFHVLPQTAPGRNKPLH